MKHQAMIVATLAALALAGCKENTEAPVDTGAAKPAKAADNQKKADEPGKAKADDAHKAFANLSVSDVDGLLADDKCVPVDANGGQTRDKYGVLPNAVLLSGHDYKVAELPSDKNSKLVFYCGNERCSSAPRAAKTAKEAGYTDVNVMAAGIRGWVKAGKTVDKPKT